MSETPTAAKDGLNATTDLSSTDKGVLPSGPTGLRETPFLFARRKLMTNEKLDEWLQILVRLGLPLMRALPLPARVQTQTPDSRHPQRNPRMDR